MLRQNVTLGLFESSTPFLEWLCIGVLTHTEIAGTIIAVLMGTEDYFHPLSQGFTMSSVFIYCVSSTSSCLSSL